MTLRVVGAGLGRTGTHSLKVALTKLLDGPCYHMIEVFPRPEHVAVWQSAAEGVLPNWDELFEGWVAAVDWPAAAFWRELSAHYPDALILLSVRDAESWWTSADRTILEGAFRRPATVEQAHPWLQMASALFRNTFTENFLDPAEAKAAFDRHNEDVRRTAPNDRLLEWQPRDGWGPLCEALGVDVPDEPFPHVNTTEDFRKMAGLD